MTTVTASKGLHRLLYCSGFSRHFPLAAADQDEEVGKIIRASIRNNREVAVTGLLLVHQLWFVQALEGPAEAVMTTYGRILTDPRHTDAIVLGAGPADSRSFGGWNMCARRLSNADDAILGTLDLKGDFDPRKLSAAKALGLLTSIAGIQARTMPAMMT